MDNTWRIYMDKKNDKTTIQQHLFTLQDQTYKEFHCRLMPTVPQDIVIGVRTPILRKYAKELYGTSEADAFLQELPHTFYEENNLHGFLIEQNKDYQLLIQALDVFLPYVDNWATCDMIRPKVFKHNLDKLIVDIRRWMQSKHCFMVRYGIEMLMCFYLEDAFLPQYPKMVAKISSTQYYVNMMIAWYFATALAKQWDVVIPYIEEQRLEKWIHNKVIQKAVESYRITAEQKKYLRSLRLK